MTDQFRALCADLHQALEKRCETLEEDRLLDRSAAALRAAVAQPVAEGVPHWSEGICGDGAAILRDGVMIPIEEVIAELNHRPTPHPPADGEVGELVTLFAVGGHCGGGVKIAPEQCRRVSDLLQRFAPTPQPVAVTERLPGPEHCTAQGWCWVFYKGFATWTLEPPLGQDGKHTGYTHWLPSNALPTPEATND